MPLRLRFGMNWPLVRSRPGALCFVLRCLIKAVARKFFLRGVSGKASALWPDLYAYFITTSSSDKSKAQI